MPFKLLWTSHLARAGWALCLTLGPLTSPAATWPLPETAPALVVPVSPARAWQALQQRTQADRLRVLQQDSARFEAELQWPEGGSVQLSVGWDEASGGTRLQWQAGPADASAAGAWVQRLAEQARQVPPDNLLCRGPHPTPEDLAEAAEPQQAPTCLYGTGHFSSALFELEKCGDFDTSLKILAACAAEQHGGGLIRLAHFFENGYGVPRRAERVAEYLRRAGESQTPGYAAMGRLHYATALYFGVGVAADRPRARALFETLARQGNADAQAFLTQGRHSAWLKPDGTVYVDPEWRPAAAVSRDQSGNDLSYGAQIHSHSRFKCLYGYVADKTGDHAAAIRIFEDCIARWNDIYSMIWLAQIYETGVGVPQDLAKATALVRRGAESDEHSGYAALARYHYGVALHRGQGTARDDAAALQWLRRAALEGVPEAAEYLRTQVAGP